MPFFVRQFGLILFFLAALPVYASSDDEEAKEWLERMSHAIKTLNYEGVFVYIHGKQIETMRIIHKNVNGEEQERLFSLAGSPREILRNKDSLICILPDVKSVVVEKSRPKNYLPVGLQHLTDDIKQYYHFHMAGPDRMAGRDAIMIDIMPKDSYRYGYHLWLDKKTAMLLKSDLVDESGNPVEQVMFTQLDIKDEIPQEKLEQTISADGYKWFKQEKQEENIKTDSQWAVTRLPSGYMKGMQTKHGLPMSRMPVEHFMYTDGISSVSVYIEAMNKDKPMMKGFSKIGAVNAYTTVISDYYVTVVGEVPKATVKFIGDSVSYTPNK
ncbi:MAG: transcriptional regulator [Gammaproteobacteria bacterium]|nr:transcriptional regulator [Gammaproteobacteria bacterium]